MKEPLTEPDENGYLRFRDSGRLVHRWLVERELGRRLEKWEVVHHIDADRRNNKRENLVLMTREEHYRIHEHQRTLDKKTAKLITTAFAVAGVILLVAGLLARAKLDLWYVGLVLLIAALAAWYFVLRKYER